MLIVDLLLSSGERRRLDDRITIPQKQIVEHAAKAPDVNLLVDSLLQYQLRGAHAVGREDLRWWMFDLERFAEIR